MHHAHEIAVHSPYCECISCAKYTHEESSLDRTCTEQQEFADTLRDLAHTQGHRAWAREFLKLDAELQRLVAAHADTSDVCKKICDLINHTIISDYRWWV